MELATFVLELETASPGFFGADFTDAQIIDAVQKVVDKYDNKVIKGTFSLYKSLDDEDPKPIKTWTMKFAN